MSDDDKLISGDYHEFTRDELRAMGFPVSDNLPQLQGTITVDGGSVTVNVRNDEDDHQ